MWPGPGLTPEGTEDKESLVVRGWQRADSCHQTPVTTRTIFSGTDFRCRIKLMVFLTLNASLSQRMRWISHI